MNFIRKIHFHIIQNVSLIQTVNYMKHKDSFKAAKGFLQSLHDSQNFFLNQQASIKLNCPMPRASVLSIKATSFL